MYSIIRKAKAAFSHRTIQTPLPFGRGWGWVAVALLITACTDTWDDHYEGTAATGTNSGSLWQAIKDNPNLSNFASVIEATGYDRYLNSSQVFTVFAPTNDAFTELQAKALISQYQQEKQQVKNVDNKVLNEFVKNHIALYNYSVSAASNDSVVLLNGKYAVLKAKSINGVALDSLHSNKLYGNGMLFTVEQPLSYRPNLFEYVAKDAELDSLRKFLYSGDSLYSDSQWRLYYKDFVPGQSVEGDIDSLGRTTYLDSVFVQENNLFGVLDQLDSEDSLFWMVAPTNSVWETLLPEYQSYYNYPAPKDKNEIEQRKRDSLAYLYPRLAIMKGTVFSRTQNKDVFNHQVSTGEVADSALSVNAVLNYSERKTKWGANFNYYEYYNAWQPGGVFAQTTDVECSNGLVRKASQWPIDKLQTFGQYIVIEAEDDANVYERSYYDDAKTGKRNYYVNMNKKSVAPDPDDNYYNKVWSNSYVECVSTEQNNQYTINFRVDNVLSNFPYDIYVVTVPARAASKYVSLSDLLPTKQRFTVTYPNPKDPKTSKTETLGNFEIKADSVYYTKVADNMVFNYANYGLTEIEPSITFNVASRVSVKEINNSEYTRTLRLDCILFVPHGTLDENVTHEGNPAVLLKPHGDHLWQHYMLR